MLRTEKAAEQMGAAPLPIGTVGGVAHRAPPGSTARTALKILELFSPKEPVLGVSEIGRRLGVHKSNISRLVAALQDEGFLARTENGRYRLGLRLYAMGASITHSHALYEAALAELSEVRIATGESTHLAVLIDAEVVHLERLRSDYHLMKSRLRSRSQLPAHATSSGKALLAHAPDKTFDCVVARGLRRYTARTLTDPEALRAELATVRSNGYALDREEFFRGITSLAVPIVARDRQTIAAMAVVAPSERMTGPHMRDTLRVLQKVAARIARQNA
jgi:DNA-binding IclR family transcriptional regulator